MEYTKGEWEAVGHCVRDEEHIEICECSLYQSSPNSNAHLIAAAPKLYEALKPLLTDFVALLKDDNLKDIYNLYENNILFAKQALSKAEGKL